MTPDIEKIRTNLEQLRSDGRAFFASITYEHDSPYAYVDNGPDHYWSQLSESDQQASAKLQSELIRVINLIANCIKHSFLLTEADRRDLGLWAKSARASLRLRRYLSWDTEVLHDEGTVLGLQQAGQSDTDPSKPQDALISFERDISNLVHLVDLLDVSPTLSSDQFRVNPQATVEYEPDSAFVMMQIDPRISELEDRYNAIRECFAQFGISAIRADDIEHEDVITEKIREKIRTSEYLIADLTGERPSVYYEVGYAHALSRRVIMFRCKGSELHFDLAAYNCPEYNNLSDLKRKLMKRLEQMTNTKPKVVPVAGNSM